MAIQGIRLAKAIKWLSDLLGRHDMLVDDHLDHLLAMSPVHDSINIDKLRNLYDEITFRKNELEGFGISPEEYFAFLQCVLILELLLATFPREM